MVVVVWSGRKNRPSYLSQPASQPDVWHVSAHSATVRACLVEVPASSDLTGAGVQVCRCAGARVGLS